VNQTGFFFEIRDLMVCFVSAFNSIVIERYDKDKNPQQNIKVSYAYAPKAKVLHDLINKAQHITLPVISVNISGIQRDTTRVFNKITGVYKGTTTGKADYLPQPVPVNINVDMNIMTSKQVDMDQILSNFIPFNDPYIIISTKVPDTLLIQQEEIRTEVLWSGSISLKYPIEQQEKSPARVTAATSFTIKGWLFKPIPTDRPSNIFKITTNYIPVSGFIYE
jgi:hypothetical protein